MRAPSTGDLRLGVALGAPDMGAFTGNGAFARGGTRIRLVAMKSTSRLFHGIQELLIGQAADEAGMDQPRELDARHMAGMRIKVCEMSQIDFWA